MLTKHNLMVQKVESTPAPTLGIRDDYNNTKALDWLEKKHFVNQIGGFFKDLFCLFTE